MTLPLSAIVMADEACVMPQENRNSYSGLSSLRRNSDSSSHSCNYIRGTYGLIMDMTPIMNCVALLLLVVILKLMKSIACVQHRVSWLKWKIIMTTRYNPMMIIL